MPITTANTVIKIQIPGISITSQFCAENYGHQQKGKAGYNSIPYFLKGAHRKTCHSEIDTEVRQLGQHGFIVHAASDSKISGYPVSVKFRSGSGEEIPRRLGKKFAVSSLTA